MKPNDDIAGLIATRIRKKRTELRLSQEKLASICGLHRTYVGAIERAEKNITVVTLRKIASALQEPLSFFLE
jgi:transcriptional regulator with XRE-family HTH domain